MMPEEDAPEFEHQDHVEIWNRLSGNSEAISALQESIDDNSEAIGTLQESVDDNSEAIAVLKSDMDWTKRILTGIFAAICITLISLIISML